MTRTVAISAMIPIGYCSEPGRARLSATCSVTPARSVTYLVDGLLELRLLGRRDRQLGDRPRLASEVLAVDWTK